jgi:hypothetical protein
MNDDKPKYRERSPRRRFRVPWWMLLVALALGGLIGVLARPPAATSSYSANLPGPDSAVDLQIVQVQLHALHATMTAVPLMPTRPYTPTPDPALAQPLDPLLATATLFILRATEAHLYEQMISNGVAPELLTATAFIANATHTMSSHQATQQAIRGTATP